jgi:hypothetical protein
MFQYKAQLLSGGYIGHCGTLCSLRRSPSAEPIPSLFWLLELKFQVQVTCVASRPLTLKIYGDDLWEGRTIGTESADPFAESLSESIMRLEVLRKRPGAFQSQGAGRQDGERVSLASR